MTSLRNSEVAKFKLCPIESQCGSEPGIPRFGAGSTYIAPQPATSFTSTKMVFGFVLSPSGSSSTDIQDGADPAPKSKPL